MVTDDLPTAAELLRVKALFQARALATVIGAPPPTELPALTVQPPQMLRLPNGDLMRTETI